MTQKSSYRQILKSSAIIGGSSVVNVVVSLLRIKIIAVLLGPTGIGLISLLQNLMATGSQISALGLNNAGTRQIAEANGNNEQGRLDAARHALFWGTIVLSVIGGGTLWLLREVLAERVLNDPTMAFSVGCLGLGVALTIVAGSQSAILAGMRRIGDIAQSQITTALFSTLLGVAAIGFLSERGLVLYILSIPFVSFVVSSIFVARIPKESSCRPSLAALAEQWNIMVRVGAAFMIAGLAGTLGQLMVRALVQRELGSEHLGYFQAAWSISMTYLGFVLGAMATDYYPRLTAAIQDRENAIGLVNEQTEVALLLAGPILLSLLGLAPWVISILYSVEFRPATSILRWQLLGDVLKVVSWPMSFVVIAYGKAILFMVSEIVVMTIFVFCTWILLPFLKLEATGVAFLVLYLAYVPMMYFILRRLMTFHWDAHIKSEILILFTCAAIVAVGGHLNDLVGAALGLIFCFGFGVRSFVKLAGMANVGGPAGKLAMFFRQQAQRFKS